MAITFESKTNNNTIIIVVLIIVVALAAVGIMAWILFSKNAEPAAVVSVAPEKLDTKIFTDERFGSLELFPQLPPPTVPAGNINPFVEGGAGVSSTITPGSVKPPVK